MNRHRMRIVGASLLALLVFWGSALASALTLTDVTPQGEVAQVRQVVARFDQSAVNFGDPKAGAPLTVACDDAQAGKGTGRWLNDKQWVFDFADDLPAGVRCTVTPVPGFKSPAGAALTAAARYTFNTGGPAVSNVDVDDNDAIDEQQLFLLKLTGPATAASIGAHVWCNAEGIGERIPVQIIEGQQRAALLKASYLKREAKKAPQRFVVLQCKRTLPPDQKVQLVYGRGVATPSGVVNSAEQRYDFKVRKPFAIDFRCERENAQAGCMPIRPLRLLFNAPVTRALAAQIVLKGGGQTFKPAFNADAEDDDNSSADSSPSAQVDQIQFAPPLAENTDYAIELPRDFKDVSGRALASPESFPLHVRTGVAPALAKFAAAPFGIVERLAEPDGVALMPITVRRVEPALAVQDYTPPRLGDLSARNDADIIAWMHKLQRYDESDVARNVAARDVHGPLPPVLHDPNSNPDMVESRAISLLAGSGNVRTLDLPRQQGNDPRPFEVVGIPLTPGFHVLEIASRKLGESLLDERYGGERAMYVRTTALVTNLAVHFKLGRENSLVWVTTLDKGHVAPNARVRVSDCAGREIATGVTDENGLAHLAGIPSHAPVCSYGKQRDWGSDAYFVSARATGDDGVEDLGFVWSDWYRGIEPWRFNLPTDYAGRPSRIAHTVFDRTLLRAGETVSMKHLIRTQTSAGFGLPETLPETLAITHLGSGEEYTQPLTWRRTPTGGQSAESSFKIPPAAKLGVYQVELRQKPHRDELGNMTENGIETGQFRVEEFRLPVMEGRIAPGEAKPLIAATAVPVDVQVNYVAGGGAARLPVSVSALVRGKTLWFQDFDRFSFAPPSRAKSAAADSGDGDDTSEDNGRVVADKLPLTLDHNGAGRLTIDKIPDEKFVPRELVLEASYADPNGETQTLRGTQTLWPAEVIAGIKTDQWASSGPRVKVQAVALDLAGKPRQGVALEVRAVAHVTTTSRKRMVGGFYTYDSHEEARPLGALCSGQSDANGLLACQVDLKASGNIELIAVARDAAGRESRAASAVWVTGQGELWFGGEDSDRIDVLPEKKSYQPGEMATFQVRSPFRFSTALVAVEREGVLEAQVLELSGQNPTFSLKVKPEWGPNVYVSVLALRGRLREVPWYSFFTWGFKSPREWWTTFWYEGKEYVAPTALVDLSKPAFRIGVAPIGVGAKSHQIDVRVVSDKPSYPARGQARITITGRLPDGQPAAGAEVALAAVDQALLELMPNKSWNLLDVMLQPRSWGVVTATAQQEIVGRRHYGRKAVPAGGGGGGKSPTRELLDTLLLWRPDIVLDAHGQATVTVPLNDALTTFRIVAVADSGLGLFGTGQTTIAATQDLQIISGLPPLVREGDEFRAQITLRNTTGQAMKVEVTPRAAPLTLPPLSVDIPAGEAREAAWTVTAPTRQEAQPGVEAIDWRIEARDTLSDARDALKLRQRLVPAVPLTVQQATLTRIDGPFSMAVAAPAGALPGRGGVRLSLQPRLAEGLDGIRDWFRAYPYNCLEQQVSKAIGMRDAKAWQAVVEQLPEYLDSDGLASYFPPRGGEDSRGSDVLTAYLLAASDEAARIDPAFALPEEARALLEQGLTEFVEGRIERKFWSPRNDLDVRKLAALEALSRYGKARADMTGSIAIAPNQWPTSAVIDWVNILRRVPGVPQRQQRLNEAMNVLKARLNYRGARLAFSTEQDDDWWWLMAGGDANAARLLLTVMDDPAWKDELPKLVNGFIDRQQKGAWHTTTANLWGELALEKFSAKFEREPVTGVTVASLGKASARVDWSQVARAQTSDAEGAPHRDTYSGAPASPGNLRGNVMSLPWGAAHDTLHVAQHGGGKPWLTLQSLAAVPLQAPLASGYAIKKTFTPIEQAVPGQYTRGDIWRVTLEVNASADMTWVAITDPIPAGATILGGGLGRDSQIATRGEKAEGWGWLAYQERSFEAFRSYYEYLPKGVVKMEYTVRLNNAGDFALPPSRVEALYAPEMFGEAPNARIKVELPK